MRALRFLRGAPGEDEVWTEWVRVEVSFVERVRGRWTVLGIGKKVEEEKTEEQMDVDEEEGAAEVEVPLMEGETKDVETDDRAKEVQEKVLSGQEAILDGAIVRVVLDNCLACAYPLSILFALPLILVTPAYSHSLAAYRLLINLLRTLPSPLRLPLLSTVYASLSSHFPSSSSSYADAITLLATRPLYDVAYNPKHKDVDSEGGFRVEGEALVDAVGEVVDEFWKACKGKKGKGKAKEKADVKVWEAFCAWLEATEDEVEDENLVRPVFNLSYSAAHTDSFDPQTVFLTTNLTTALSLSPSSPFISLLHLRHLLRTTAPHSTILTFAKSITPPSPSSSLPADLSTSESLWVARLETVVALAALPTITSTFTLATSALPFSGRIWDVHAEWIERTGAEDVSAWYEASIRRVLRADAVPPVGFVSQFEGLEPRELLPRRYLGYLVTKGEDIQGKVESLLRSAPALSIDFLSFALGLAGPGVRGSAEARFREMMHARIVEHCEAGAVEWVAYAKELLRMGEVVKSNEVVRRAMRTLKGGELAALERRWTEVCDA